MKQLRGPIVFLLCIASPALAAPGLRIDPDPIGFGGSGMLNLGGMPGEQQFGFFSVTNTGTTVLHVKDMEITGSGGVIEFDDTVCGQGTTCHHKFDVPAGGQAFFSVSCVAPTPGAFTATLDVKSNASGHHTAPLSCTGLHPPVIEVSPNGLDFGTAHGCWSGDVCGPRCNTQPATQTLTITNAAADPSELDLATVLPQDGPDWDFTIESEQQPPYILTAGQSVHVTFTFHPMSPNGADTYDGLTLTPTYPFGLAPIAVPFHAHKGWGQLAIDTPAPLGNVAVGQTLTATITAHDAGDSCLDILHVFSEGDLSLVSPTSGLVLQAGETHSWTVTCTAPGENGGSGFLDFDKYNDDPEFESFQFYCQPTGAGLAISPPLVSFDGYDAPVGGSTSAFTIVFNPGDTATDLVAMTSSDPHYSASLDGASLPLTLNPGDSAGVFITFSPTDTARVDATILFDASVGSDFTLHVTGAGVDGPAPPPVADTAAPPSGGGCSTGGATGWPTVLALLALRRRRQN